MADKFLLSKDISVYPSNNRFNFGNNNNLNVQGKIFNLESRYWTEENIVNIVKNYNNTKGFVVSDKIEKFFKDAKNYIGIEIVLGGYYFKLNLDTTMINTWTNVYAAITISDTSLNPPSYVDTTINTGMGVHTIKLTNLTSGVEPNLDKVINSEYTFTGLKISDIDPTAPNITSIKILTRASASSEWTIPQESKIINNHIYTKDIDTTNIKATTINANHFKGSLDTTSNSSGNIILGKNNTTSTTININKEKLTKPIDTYVFYKGDSLNTLSNIKANYFDGLSKNAENVNITNKDIGNNANINFQIGNGTSFSKTVNNVANVSTSINNKLITDIFEKDGLKVKNASLSNKATNVDITNNDTGNNATVDFQVGNGISYNKTINNVSNVTTSINGKLISNIFELDGLKVKKATTADVANKVDWSNVVSKPSTYTPSSHTHTSSQITDFANAVKVIKVNNATNADNVVITNNNSNNNVVNFNIGTGNYTKTINNVANANYSTSSNYANSSGSSTTAGNVSSTINNKAINTIFETDGITAKKSSIANKLTTARTITLGGDVSGSFTFDGSSNASPSVTVNKATALKSTNIGDNKHPVYFDANGKPVKIETVASADYSTNSTNSTNTSNASIKNNDDGDNANINIQIGNGTAYKKTINNVAYASSSDYANTSGVANSVAWGNVSGRPTFSFDSASGVLNITTK